MRTTLPHILPGCVYCNFDHDPANECRFQPESARFQLKGTNDVHNETNDGGRTAAGNTPTCEGCDQPSDHCTCCEHDPTEDCLNCSSCGKCSESLDEENELCISCRKKRAAPGEHPFFGPVIYAYTRAQAIEDGTLINLGMFVARGRPVLDLVGIRFPVAITSTAYHDVTGEGEGPELLHTDLITQRVVYLLGRLKRAILEHKGDDPTRVDFVCTLPWVGWPATVALYAVVGPGDNGEPVITIMLPGED